MWFRRALIVYAVLFIAGLLLGSLTPMPQAQVSDKVPRFSMPRPGTLGFLLLILSHNLVIGFILFLLGFSLIVQVVVLFIDGLIDGLLINSVVHENPAVLLYLLPHGPFEILGLSLLAYSGYLMYSVNAGFRFVVKYLVFGFVLIVVAAYIEGYVSTSLVNWFIHRVVYYS